MDSTSPRRDVEASLLDVVVVVLTQKSSVNKNGGESHRHLFPILFSKGENRKERMIQKHQLLDAIL